MQLSEFDYHLPEHLIAQAPCDSRDKSSLLIVQPDDELVHTQFDHIIDYFRKDDVLVINETKVNAFRLNGIKVGGGASLECLFMGNRDEVDSTVYQVIARPMKRLKPGVEISFCHELRGKVLAREHYTCKIKLYSEDKKIAVKDLLSKLAQPPLPPYIARRGIDDHQIELDRDRYQTVYARNKGSIAAPTAGFHFSESLLEKLREKGVIILSITLHIGYGTFRPIQVENVEFHTMDEEYYEISESVWETINRTQKQRCRLFAVGTTVIRSLESVMRSKKGNEATLRGKTDLFIYPGYQFNLAYTGMITNFHLPKSTLLLLVSAFAGQERIKKAYKAAIENKYRFYSYGDAMLLFK